MIYLDNAATSYPKPDCVKNAVEFAISSIGGNPGRSSHTMSMSASLEVFRTRQAIAELFGASPENIVFTYNCTYALNIAIKSSYIYGAHILISDLEHNSVLRPSASITSDNFTSYSIFDSYIEESMEEREHSVITSIRSKLKPLTKTIICTARSNITGTPMPLRSIGKFCRENGLFFIVDAAQSAGYDDINIERDFIDALCAPGHKGLYGTTGTGFIVYSKHAVQSGRISTFIEGGNGVQSLDVGMPDTLPERLEGGTLNVPGIVGLHSAIDYINSIGTSIIREHHSTLTKRAYNSLAQNKKIKIYSYTPDSSIILFNIDSIDCEKVAQLLDTKGFCVRSGYHCAPLAHNRLSTGCCGAIRVSVGLSNTINDIDNLVDTVNKISAHI